MNLISLAELSSPGLPATGADLAALLPWIIVAAVVVLAGGVLLVVRSRRKPVVPPVASTPELPPAETPES